jgi:hypothetical protein
MTVTRRGGWRRLGRRRFRYETARGERVDDERALERIRGLTIPPAWTDVWISPNPRAKLQATGVDAAGRRQYLYHPDFRAAQDERKFERLVRFGELRGISSSPPTSRTGRPRSPSRSSTAPGSGSDPSATRRAPAPTA